MKNPVLLFLAFFSVSGLFGQETDPVNELLNEYQVEVNQQRSRLEEQVDGTPYFSEDYVTSRIFFKDQKQPVQAELRYNVYSDEFEFLQAGSLFAISNKEQIDSLQYMGRKFVYGKYRDESGDIRKGYMHQMVKGDCALYKIYNIQFYEAEPPSTGYDDYKPARFEEENPVYCLQMKEDDQPSEIESFRRGKFLDRFGKLEPELKRTIRDQNIRLRREDNLVRFIRYYNANY